MTHNEFVSDVIARLKVRNIKGLNVDEIRDTLHLALQNIVLTRESTEIAVTDQDMRAALLRKYISCKMVEGCSDRTISYYQLTLKKFMLQVPKPIDQMTTDDIRLWMAIRMQRDRISKTTQDNERRILNSFFNWAVENDYIHKSPMRRIKKVKQEKRVRKPFSDVEVEKLRNAAQGDLRLTAMLEVLFSTGVRVSELVGMDRDEIDGDEIIVFGKGAKERAVYLNARAQVTLKLYLDSRPEDDLNPAMFVSMQRPYDRLGISAVESDVRELGKRAGVNDVHPHRFRRTAATTALNRGMPIDQVQQMLGHAQIATTLIYAQSSQSIVKQSHKKLM